jgi:hypothetical protein
MKAVTFSFFLTLLSKKSFFPEKEVNHIYSVQHGSMISQNDSLSNLLTEMSQRQSPHANNYRSSLYAVNSDTTKIAPTWGKVTSTPWTAEAQRLQGYGRHIAVNYNKLQ